MKKYIKAANDNSGLNIDGMGMLGGQNAVQQSPIAGLPGMGNAPTHLGPMSTKFPYQGAASLGSAAAGGGQEQQNPYAEAANISGAGIEDIQASINQLNQNNQAVLPSAVNKYAAQDNSKPQISSTGEDNGVSFTTRDEDHATGPDAWASLSKFMKKANRRNRDIGDALKKTWKGALGGALGGSALAGGAVGGGLGGLYGLLSDPGEDEEGEEKSRLWHALKGLGLGGVAGAGAGVAGFGGGLVGGTVGGVRGLGGMFGNEKPAADSFDNPYVHAALLSLAGGAGGAGIGGISNALKGESIGRGAVTGGLTGLGAGAGIVPGMVGGVGAAELGLIPQNFITAFGGGSAAGAGLGGVGGYQLAQSLMRDEDEDEREKKGQLSPNNPGSAEATILLSLLGGLGGTAMGGVSNAFKGEDIGRGMFMGGMTGAGALGGAGLGSHGGLMLDDMAGIRDGIEHVIPALGVHAASTAAGGGLGGYLGNRLGNAMLGPEEEWVTKRREEKKDKKKKKKEGKEEKEAKYTGLGKFMKTGDGGVSPQIPEIGDSLNLAVPPDLDQRFPANRGVNDYRANDPNKLQWGEEEKKIRWGTYPLLAPIGRSPFAAQYRAVGAEHEANEAKKGPGQKWLEELARHGRSNEPTHREKLDKIYKDRDMIGKGYPARYDATSYSGPLYEEKEGIDKYAGFDLNMLGLTPSTSQYQNQNPKHDFSQYPDFAKVNKPFQGYSGAFRHGMIGGGRQIAQDSAVKQYLGGKNKQYPLPEGVQPWGMQDREGSKGGRRGNFPVFGPPSKSSKGFDKYAKQPAGQLPRHDCHGVHPDQTHEEWVRQEFDNPPTRDWEREKQSQAPGGQHSSMVAEGGQPTSPPPRLRRLEAANMFADPPPNRPSWLLPDTQTPSSRSGEIPFDIPRTRPVKDLPPLTPLPKYTDPTLPNYGAEVEKGGAWWDSLRPTPIPVQQVSVTELLKEAGYAPFQCAFFGGLSDRGVPPELFLESIEKAANEVGEEFVSDLRAVDLGVMAEKLAQNPTIPTPTPMGRKPPTEFGKPSSDPPPMPKPIADAANAAAAGGVGGAAGGLKVPDQQNTPGTDVAAANKPWLHGMLGGGWGDTGQMVHKGSKMIGMDFMIDKVLGEGAAHKMHPLLKILMFAGGGMGIGGLLSGNKTMGLGGLAMAGLPLLAQGFMDPSRGNNPAAGGNNPAAGANPAAGGNPGAPLPPKQTAAQKVVELLALPLEEQQARYAALPDTPPLDKYDHPVKGSTSKAQLKKLHDTYYGRPGPQDDGDNFFWNRGTSGPGGFGNQLPEGMTREHAAQLSQWLRLHAGYPNQQPAMP